MRRYLLRSIHILLPLSLLLCAIAFRVVEPEVLQRQKVIVFDIFNQWFPRRYNPDIPVRIVDIDDESLEKMGQWPWPRTRLAQLIDRLSEANAAVIAFDIVFAEPDRTSPRNVVEIWSDNPEYQSLRQQVRALPDHDQLFAKKIKGLSQITSSNTA